CRTAAGTRICDRERQLQPRTSARFGQDVAYMVGDRPTRQDQSPRDLLIAQPLSNEHRDLLLTRCEFAEKLVGAARNPVALEKHMHPLGGSHAASQATL